MGFRKYQKVEKVEVLNDEKHGVIKTFLTKVGKTKVEDLTNSEKGDLNKKLDN